MQLNGKQLRPEVQAEVLRKFVHRFTVDRVPQWARNTDYPPQFADDADWLAHTWFYVRKDGWLDERYNYCESHPTWPQGKGIGGRMLFL